MSSTVGYGIKIVPVGDTELLSGDIEELILTSHPEMTVVFSRAEYGDENDMFIFLAETVTEAGKSDEVVTAPLNFHTPDASPFEAVFSDSDPYKPVGELGWYLVDYYEFS